MKPEIEVKFLNIDVEAVREKLRTAGATLEQPMRLMRRDQFDHADNRYRKSYYAERLRIRDEGNKCTMTYKARQTNSPYPIEIETTVDSYDTAKQLLEAVGLHSFSYQESKRETWRLDGVEIEIDEWPWVRPFVEIEGETEDLIKATAAKLGFSWKDRRFGSSDTVYRAEYTKMTQEDSIGDIAEVRFNRPVPEYLKGKK